MNKYFFVLILTLIILVGTTFKIIAQIKIQDTKATISLNNGELLSGFIKDEILSKMNMGVKFRTTTNKEFTTYTIQEFKSIQLNNGENYKVINASKPRDTIKRNLLGTLILKGKLSLYEAIYNESTVYIAVKDNDTFWLQDDELDNDEKKIKRYYFKQILFNAVQDGEITENEVNHINFTDDDILEVITKYNSNKNSKSEKIVYKIPNEKFVVAGISANFFDKDKKESLVNIFYRIYNPRISKSTSINIGIQYSYFQETILVNHVKLGIQQFKPTYSTLSLPFLVQQNILNKSVRPYFKGGLALTYSKITNHPFPQETGFQKTYGMGVLFGVGLEVDIYKGLMLKSDFFKDQITHLVTAGLAYNWRLNK